MQLPHPPQWAKRSAAAVHGTRAGAPRNTAGTTSQSRPRRTAQRPPHGSKQGKAMQRRAAGARGTTGHAHRRKPSARGHTSAGPRRRPAACSITLLMLAACCKPPRESTTDRALSLCSGRAAARHGCEHKTCYRICGGVVAAGAHAQAADREHGEAARSGRPRWPRGKISPFL